MSYMAAVLGIFPLRKMHRDYFDSEKKKVSIVSLKIAAPSLMSCTSTMLLLFSFPDLWFPGLALHSKVWTWTQWLLESPPWVHTTLGFSLCIVFFSYLFKYFSSACNVFENGSDVITNSVTSLLKPVIPSWLRWRYWFGWDCSKYTDIRRRVVFQCVCDFSLVVGFPPPIWFGYSMYVD